MRPTRLTALALLLLPLSLAARGDTPDSDLKPGQFIRTWLLLGPLPFVDGKADPDDEQLEQAFQRDLLADTGGETGVQPRPDAPLEIEGREVAWRRVTADDGLVDLDRDLSKSEFAIAYAWAEFTVAKESSSFLGLGSDDGVKVWLNGKLVHDHRVARALETDDDLVPVTLREGRNRLLLKVQNQRDSWGFACRILDARALEERLLEAAGFGDLDTVKMLVAAGVRVDTLPKFGLTPLHAARIRGFREVAEYLVAQGADPDLQLPPAEEQLDAFLRDRLEGKAGLAVLVAKDGKVLFERGYGHADLGHQVPVTPETKFRIGSVTKQFTAAAVLKLEEEGKLSVHDKLAKYFPDFPRGDEVTLHHLLTHTSGIRSYTDKPDFFDTVTVPTEPEDLIDSFRNDPYDFSPGKGWHYCNSGYFLLGQIVAKVSGDSYEKFLDKRFFEPLGMKDTGVHDHRKILEHEATGYSYTSGKLEKALDWNMSRAAGAGALYSTVGDLHRWNEALFGGKVLSEDSLRQAFTPVQLGENVRGLPYGYGWIISGFRGLKAIEHSGGLHGFLSHLARYPEENFTVAVLVNVSPPPPEISPASLAQEIAQLYLWPAMEPRDSRSVDKDLDTELFDDYVGRYDYGPAVLIVTREGKRLFAQLTGQPRFEIFPRAKDEFFWKVVDAQVTFVRDPTGAVVRALHRQSGQEIKAPRLHDTEVDIDPALYDSYAGKYDFGGGAILTVRRKGDQLHARLTGQPEFEIFPASATEFFWKVINARITFIKDGSGKVTKALHRQGGRTLDARKIE